MGAIVSGLPLLSHVIMLLGSYILQLLSMGQVQALQQTMQSLLSSCVGSQDCQDYQVRSFLRLQDQSDEQPWRADIATLGLGKQQILSVSVCSCLKACLL